MPNYALLGLQQASQPPIGNPVPGSALLDPSDMDQDPLIRQRLIQSRLNDELKDRINTELAAPDAGTPGRLAALKNMLGQTQEDLGEPGTTPTTPLGIQAQDVRATNAGNLAAQRQGFSGTQEQAGYGRLQEALKAQQPLEIEKSRAAAQIEAAKQQGIAAEQSKERAGGTFMENLHKQYPQGIPPGMTIKGPGGLEIARGSGAQLLSPEADKEINALEGQKWKAPFDQIPIAKQTNDKLNARINSILAQHGQPPRYPVAAPQASGDVRQQAINELQAAGHAITEANIQYAISQLGKQ